MTTSSITYESYWNMVLGANRTAASVVEEFGLDAGDYHTRALDALCSVEVAS